MRIGDPFRENKQKEKTERRKKCLGRQRAFNKNEFGCEYNSHHFLAE